MNDRDILSRFEELEAGRILGDLDLDEIKELERLSQDPRCQSDLTLELTAAALEVEFFKDQEPDLPKELFGGLRKGMVEFVLAEPGEEKVVHLAAWKRLLMSPRTGWAIAALLTVLLIAKSFVEAPLIAPPAPVGNAPEKGAPGAARETLVAKAGDLVESKFGGTGEYQQMSGTVIWSDEFQEGYMSLTNLPANDPNTSQYQLWIVDLARDEKPVDGGVFDISDNDGTAIIPIRNPLVVTNPRAFVITLEQPGGVVVSKQEVVVASATTS